MDERGKRRVLAATRARAQRRRPLRSGEHIETAGGKAAEHDRQRRLVGVFDTRGADADAGAADPARDARAGLKRREYRVGVRLQAIGEIEKTEIRPADKTFARLLRQQ